MSVGAADDELLTPSFEGGSGPVPDQVDEILAANAAGQSDTAGDPRDLIANAPNPNAVAPESIVPPPELGPPKPDPVIDGMLAKIPPGASGEPTGAQPAAVPKAEEVIQRQAELDKAKAEDAARAAEQAHMAAIDHQADVQDATDHGNALLTKRQAAYDASLAKYEKMHVSGYWDEPTHSRFAAAIGLALGGLGAALSAAGGGSGENRVLTQLNKKIDDDFLHQKFQIEKARDSVAMAKTGIADAREAKAALLEDVTARRVATLSSLETEARRQLAERGVPAAQIDADTRVLQLQAARVKAAREADEQKRKDAMSAAQIKYLEARAGKLGRGAGGGGGAGKPGAVVEFKRAIVEGKDGKPLNAAEIQEVADRLGIPAVAKAGRPSVENLTKDVAFVAGQKTKADALDLKRNDKFDTELQKELYPPGGKGPGTQLERIEAMRGELKSAIASGDKTAATRVLEEAGGMLSGGKSTKNTVHLLEELKSSSDKMSSLWGRITSNPGDTKEYTQRLDKLLEGAAGEKKLEIDSITKRYDERRGKKAGEGAKSAAPPANAKPPTMVIGSTVYRLQPDGTYK